MNPQGHCSAAEGTFIVLAAKAMPFTITTPRKATMIRFRATYSPSCTGRGSRPTKHSTLVWESVRNTMLAPIMTLQMKA
jgi:hypothetical protein